MAKPKKGRIPFCPKCGTAGAVQDSCTKKVEVSLICDTCGSEWQSLAGKCYACGKHNGFPGDGTCSPCYTKKKAGE